MTEALRATVASPHRGSLCAFGFPRAAPVRGRFTANYHFLADPHNARADASVPKLIQLRAADAMRLTELCNRVSGTPALPNRRMLKTHWSLRMSSHGAT